MAVSYLIEDHQRVSEPIKELRLVLQSHFSVVLKAQFLHFGDDVIVCMFVDVLEPALAGHCPTHKNAVFGVSCQVADEGIFVLVIDMLPHFKALDVVEGLLENDLLAEVSLLHVGGVGVRSCIDSPHLIALIF